MSRFGFVLMFLGSFCIGQVFSQLPSYVTTNGLVGWWPFNGNANDESGNGNNGTVIGVNLTTDRFGNANSAYNFDYATVGFGTQTDEIYIPYSPIFNTPSVTISIWVYQRQYYWSGNTNPPMSTLAARFQYGYSNPNGQVWMLNSGTNGINGFAGASNNTLNQWTHILTTFENGIGKMYINGQLINTQNNLSPLNIFGNSGISIGESNQANGCWWPTDGVLDDFALWNRALTQQEIMDLYNSNNNVGCNLGSITSPTSTLCIGESISLEAKPAITAEACFNPRVKQAGNQNFTITSNYYDVNGNYYLSGAYSGSISIDGVNLAGIGNRDIFLVKYNNCGKLQWAVRGGSSGDQDYAGEGNQGIVADAVGNVYIVGRYNQAFTFYGTSSTSFSAPWTSASNSNHQDGFMVKLSPGGQVLWGASLRGGSNDGFNGVVVDSAGNPIVTGGFNGCCPSSFAVTIFGPNGSVGVSSFGSNYGSGIVVKFDSSGNILWKAAVYNRDTGLGSVAVDDSNNIYLTGSFRSWNNGTAAQFVDATGTNNLLFNPGIGLGFLVKLNNNGVWQWGTTFGNVGDGVGSLTSASDVEVDEAGNPWVVGYFRGAQAIVYSTNGFNLTIPASANDIGFLISYNSNGIAQSVVTRQQSTGSTYYHSLAIANNNISIAGHYTGNNFGLSDLLVANYSLTGVFNNVQTAGGSGQDYALSIRSTGSSFAVCGSTDGGFTLDGVNITGSCSYLWSMDAGQSKASVTWSTGAKSSVISISPSESTKYTATFSDGINSCSQEVTVNVKQPSSASIEAYIKEGEGYNFNGQYLTTDGIYYDTIQNLAGCDSTVILNLVVEPLVFDCKLTASKTSICEGNQVTLEIQPSNPCNLQEHPSWQLLIPSNDFIGAEINFNNTGFDKANSKFYSVLKSSSVNRVYCFDLNTNKVTSLTSNGAPSELYSYAFDFTNQRLIATRAGRDVVYSLPLSGGNWQSIGSGGGDYESYGGRAFWNPVSNRFGYFGGYGYFAVKNWIWEQTGTGWVNPYPNNNNCNPAKRNTQFASNENGDKLFIFSGQGSCDGNQLASSCSLGSPWQTDVGQYCWLRDLYELNLSNYQFTNILPPNNQSILREGAFAYDYDNDVFYIIGGFIPSGNYNQNVNNYGNSFSMEVLRFRKGIDSGFLPILVEGTIPPVPNNSIGSGTAVYDSKRNRIIYVRSDGVWALNLSAPCDQNISWSTGETTPSINISPYQTSKYSVTLTQGNKSCSNEVTIVVNQTSTPTFTQVGPFLLGAAIPALSTTSTNGITGTWSPAINNTATTSYTFTPTAGQCATTATMTISIQPPATFNVTASNNTICTGSSVTLSANIGPSYPLGTVHCSGTPTSIVDVTNPVTGKTWMDRNLGASRVATSSTDAAAYGDLYQWGRGADGHQCRNSATTTILSSTDQLAHGNFILVSNSPYDWRSPQNTNLWQGVNGVNNPCPIGYRIPTEMEFNNEVISWSSQNTDGSFESILKFCLAGRREFNSGILGAYSYAYYWNSTFSGSRSSYLNYGSSLANTVANFRAYGFSVRCIKN